jgi:hypothetical protein
MECLEASSKRKTAPDLYRKAGRNAEAEQEADVVSESGRDVL